MILALLACASPPVAPAPLAARAAPLEITPLVADADGALIPAVAGVTPLRYVQWWDVPRATIGVEVQDIPCDDASLDVDMLARGPEGTWIPLSWQAGPQYGSRDDQGRLSSQEPLVVPFAGVCALNGGPVTVTWLAMDLCTGATASAVVELPLWIDPYYCATETP